MSVQESPRLYVIAGVNGAGKSSIAGSIFRALGSNYFNPDEAACRLMAVNPGLGQGDANSAAWRQGVRLLKRAIEERLDFAFETTLGGHTITHILAQAATRGIEIHIWYVGLSSPELHLERVRSRVRRGGHDIPERDIRRRYGIVASTSLHFFLTSRPCGSMTIARRRTPLPGRRRCPCCCCRWNGRRLSGRRTSRAHRTGPSQSSPPPLNCVGPDFSYRNTLFKSADYLAGGRLLGLTLRVQ